MNDPYPLSSLLSDDAADAAEQAADVEPRFSRQHWLWLLGATLLAAALRLWHLGEWSFWIDEAHTWRDATMPLDGESGFLSSDRGFYPITYLALRGLLALGAVGDDEFSLRMPFALLGIASVPLLALCGRRLVGPTAAVAAALLCACHPWHIYWSQNARGYVIVFVAAVVVVDRIVRWLQLHHRRDLVFAIVALLVGALSHPTGAFMGIGVVLFLLLRPFARADGRRLLIVAGVAVTSVVLLSWVLAIVSPYDGFFEAKNEPSVVHLLQTVAYYFRPALLLAGLVGLVLGGLRWSTLRGLLITCLLLAPLVVLLVIGGSLVKATARYAYCTLPLWLLLAGRACVPWLSASFANWRTGAGERVLPAAFLAAVLAVDLVDQAAAYHVVQFGQRARWREACAVASEQAQRPGAGGGLRVVTINAPSTRYYLARHAWTPAGALRYPDVEIHPLLRWQIHPEPGKQGFHPGGREHLQWHVQEAAHDRAALAVMVTLPELAEVDLDGKLLQTLQADFELLLYLPCQVGPKDESLFVFVPRPAR